MASAWEKPTMTAANALRSYSPATGGSLPRDGASPSKQSSKDQPDSDEPLPLTMGVEKCRLNSSPVRELIHTNAF